MFQAMEATDIDSSQLWLVKRNDSINIGLITLLSMLHFVKVIEAERRIYASVD